MTKRLEQQVRRRAGGMCEYCKMATWLYDQPFHVDHIISRKHGGPTALENLALACLDCNAFKGTDIAGIDDQTSQLCRLFNPRTDRWDQHFEWRGPILVGKTPAGRTTVRLLSVNQPIRVRARAVLMAEGVFPPRASSPV